MKQAWRTLLKLLPEGLLGIAALLALLMVLNLYKSAQPVPYTAQGNALVLPSPAGLPAAGLLNAGDAAALDQLPGVGAVLAQRIIAVRESDGPFYYLEDLMTVSGIGEKRFTEIMAWLTLHEATPTDLPIGP